MSRKEPGFSFFGVTSLIVVIIVLMMVCLSVLTYVNSNNDYNLAKMAAASNTAYYQAEVEAAHRLSALAGQSAGGSTVSCQVDIDENRCLDCEAILGADGSIEAITSWKTTIREQ